MTLESIKKLRSLAPIGFGHIDFMKAVDAVENELEKDYVPRKLAKQDAAIKDELATELEELKREISGRYMPPPMDADGVIWTIHDIEFIDEDGDRHELDDITYSLKLHKWVLVSHGVCRCDASYCHHVKPRTVEDMLAKHRFEADRLYCNPKIGDENRMNALKSLDAKYADEIRELMGVRDD